MFSPFPTEIAYHYCLILKRRLDEGFIKLEQVTRLSMERAGQGLMIGCLVCADKNGRRVVLCANSGISRKIICNSQDSLHNSHKYSSQDFPEMECEWIENGIHFIVVPPIVTALEVDKALKKNDEEIHRLTDVIHESKCRNQNNSEDITSDKNSQDFIISLMNKRKQLCDESLESVRKLYKFKTINNNEFGIVNFALPTGTGDCCEPKLLHYAFGHDLKPLSLAQIFYQGSGAEPRGEGCGEDRPLSETKGNGLNPGERLLPSKIELIPPCDERCGRLLPEMLGLGILYCDKYIVVVNKPSGLLSVPGKGEEKQDCVVNRIKKLYPDLCSIKQPSVHRLDMETSGILVLAFTEEAHKNLSLQFEKGSVHKEYVALLEGVLEKQGAGANAPKHGEKSGIMKLKFRLDPDNRPHQIYDEIYGKEGITRWQNEGLVWYETSDGKKIKATKIRFFPETGRTHQLRLASADLHGFGLPIIGDSLYGNFMEGQRLMLHAEKITFSHPINNRKLSFVLPFEY